MRTLLTEIQATFRLERDEIQQAKRLRWEQSYDAQAVLYGLPGPRVRELSALFYARVRPDGKERIFATCEELLQAGSVEERTLAFDWAYRQRKSFTPDDFLRFQSWLEPYVRSWGACDDLCTHALGCPVGTLPATGAPGIPLDRFRQPLDSAGQRGLSDLLLAPGGMPWPMR